MGSKEEVGEMGLGGRPHRGRQLNGEQVAELERTVEGCASVA